MPASLAGEYVLYLGRGRDCLNIPSMDLINAVRRNAQQPVTILQEGDPLVNVADWDRRIHLAVFVNVGVVLGEAAALPVGVNRLSLNLADRAAAEDRVLPGPL